MTVVVGTAGHVDHGKTSLLRALTGIDADRLPDERRRGMTIDVGYAHLALPDGSQLDFVDVPGHDRLVGNMLVGAGEIDAALLVVAADDGPRAQTLEHLELLDALGIHHGMAVVTKIDLVESARTDAVVAEVAALLGRSTLAGSPVLAASAVTGEGIEAVRDALSELRDRVLAGSPAAAIDRAVRLAIDRVFSVKGRGVVVTGTLRGGRLTRGASLRLEPGGAPLRARELQVHGGSVEAVEGGGRVAINVAGIDAAELTRGGVLTDDPRVRPSDRLTVILRPPARLGAIDPLPGWPPRVGANLRLHLGTDAVDATPGRGRSDGVELPDGRRVATLRLGRPIAAAVGDAFVLRVPSPTATAAGGVVIESVPPVGVSRRRATPEALAALASAWLAADPTAELAARVGVHGLFPRPPHAELPPEVRPSAGWLIGSDVAAAVDAEALRLVRAQHDTEPLAPGLPLARLRRELVRVLRRRVTADERTAGAVIDGLIDGLIVDGRLTRAGEAIRDPSRSSGALPTDVLAAMDRLEAALGAAAPPPLGETARAVRCPAEGVRALEAAGRIVVVEPDLAWAGSTYHELEALALRLADPGPLTPAAFRDASGTSRKFVMALLEDFDRRGTLRRTPAGHVRGPRAALPR